MSFKKPHANALLPVIELSAQASVTQAEGGGAEHKQVFIAFILWGMEVGFLFLPADKCVLKWRLELFPLRG